MAQAPPLSPASLHAPPPAPPSVLAILALSGSDKEHARGLCTRCPVSEISASHSLPSSPVAPLSHLSFRSPSTCCVLRGTFRTHQTTYAKPPFGPLPQPRGHSCMRQRTGGQAHGAVRGGSEEQAAGAVYQLNTQETGLWDVKTEREKTCSLLRGRDLSRGGTTSPFRFTSLLPKAFTNMCLLN